MKGKCGICKRDVLVDQAFVNWPRFGEKWDQAHQACFDAEPPQDSEMVYIAQWFEYDKQGNALWAGRWFRSEAEADKYARERDGTVIAQPIVYQGALAR